MLQSLPLLLDISGRAFIDECHYRSHPVTIKVSAKSPTGFNGHRIKPSITLNWQASVHVGIGSSVNYCVKILILAVYIVVLIYVKHLQETGAVKPGEIKGRKIIR
ncbi:hypothetical protein KIL84_016527 [Mauremys mutica]|uniref:Uncharacterized protein n=1 Tax=Mauremys mutica TaxID=74926 RepID=A0A9D3X4E8_9SAUR|nr:hypothetical protein KIL84_016527 [Mauremys mutica]